LYPRDGVSEVYLTLTEHLEELRRCLLRSILAVVFGFLLSYQFVDLVFGWVVAPLRARLEPGQSLIGTGVAEAFFTEIKVALVAGIFLASPVIFYQVWRFVAPGLHPHEKRLVVPFVLATSFFFAAGALFCYWVVLPLAFVYFLEQYRSLGVAPEIRIGEYFSFFFRMVFAFGLAFELPVLTLFFARLGLCDHTTLWRHGRYAVVAIFVLAAMLTPGPDVVSQVLLAVPLLFLYSLSIAVAYFWGRRRG
jgi:sec-independent protein translocase protein TatC